MNYFDTQLSQAVHNERIQAETRETRSGSINLPNLGTWLATVGDKLRNEPKTVPATKRTRANA